MKRLNIKDTRAIAELPLHYGEIDPVSITQADINRLVVKIAEHLGVLNPRTFRSIEKDPLISEAERAELLAK